MADNKPTFHHLNNSQSQRIAWLLGELEIKYNLVLHHRNALDDPKAPFRSPPSLLSTGPYGKAPLLITGAKDGNRYIPESAAIATYLIRTFDTQDKFGLRSGDWVRDEVLTSICMSNLGRANGFMLYLDLGIIKNGNPPVADGPELRNWLRHLERELKEGPEGGFFMGKQPGRADIMLEFPMSFIKHRNWVNLEEEFPPLDQWLKRVYNRPAWKRALNMAFDGIYDPSVFPFKGRSEL